MSLPTDSAARKDIPLARPVAEPCAACYHEAFLHTKSGECMEWKCACGRFEAESPAVAEKSPDECSICRGRHGSEVTHACE